ncbi:MAG: S8 family serine peptidase [Vicinamibacterales bacterium]
MRVAVIDSGVHAAHPHVNGVAGGVGIDLEGREHDDFVDRLGHGTAVTAVIREKAPLAEILAIKVFDRELSASGRALVAACEWALKHQARLLNLSLGTLNGDHEAALIQVVAHAQAAGAVIVAAGPEPDRRWLPGSIPGVWRVTLDWRLPRDRCRAQIVEGNPKGLPLHKEVPPYVEIRASGFPRPIPGGPSERNLKGLSFAVANATGLLAALFHERLGEVVPIELLSRAMTEGWGTSS